MIFDIDEQLLPYMSKKQLISKQRAVIHRLKSVLNELPGNIYWKNKDGVYLGHNDFSKNTMHRFGLERIIIGKTDHDLFSKEVAEQYRAHDLKVMQLAVESVIEETLLLPTGEKLTQLSYKRPLRDEHGVIIGCIGNTIDITKLKKIEMDLRHAKNKAEKANQIKNETIKNMEHDVRTPFHGIMVLAEILKNQETDVEKNKNLTYIVDSAKELLNYFNNVLEFIKLDTHIIPVLEEKFDLTKVINEVYTIEKAAATSKQLNLICNISSDIPKIIISDSNKIKKILLNLVSNAIKFTSIGFVKISAKCIKQINSQKIIVCLVVEDTGAGMSKDQQAYVYERFNSVTQKNINMYGGLGLKIIRFLIHDLEGELDLKTELGKGTKFICTIPCKVPLVEQRIELDDLT